MFSKKKLKQIQVTLATKIQLWLSSIYFKNRNTTISVYDVLKEFIKKFKEDDLFERAYSIAFNFTLAIFPTTIFLFTVIPYIPIPALDTKIIAFLQAVMPQDAYSVIYDTIQDIVNQPRKGLLSFGFFSALYLSTSGMMSITKALNHSCGVFACKKRGYIKQRLIAALLTFLLAFLSFFSILLLTIGTQALNYLIANQFITSNFYINLIVFLKFSIIFLAFFMAIAVVYYLAPTTIKRFLFISFGAFIATLLNIAASFGFSSYVNHFTDYNRLYGSIGVIIVLMTWLFILAFILLVGFELNVSLYKLSHHTEKTKAAIA